MVKDGVPRRLSSQIQSELIDQLYLAKRKKGIACTYHGAIIMNETLHPVSLHLAHGERITLQSELHQRTREPAPGLLLPHTQRYAHGWYRYCRSARRKEHLLVKSASLWTRYAHQATASCGLIRHERLLSAYQIT